MSLDVTYIVHYYTYMSLLRLCAGDGIDGLQQGELLRRSLVTKHCVHVLCCLRALSHRRAVTPTGNGVMGVGRILEGRQEREYASKSPFLSLGPDLFVQVRCMVIYMCRSNLELLAIEKLGLDRVPRLGRLLRGHLCLRTRAGCKALSTAAVAPIRARGNEVSDA